MECLYFWKSNIHYLNKKKLPIFYLNQAEDYALAIWKIEEDIAFFPSSIYYNQQITHPQKKLQHLAGRYLLSILEPDFPYQLMQVNTASKPYIPNFHKHFSISHCKQFAAAVISKNTCGIDVEIVNEKMQVIKHKFAHASEIRWVNSLPCNIQPLALTIIWSAKEALYKWWGNGEVDFKEHLRIMPFVIANNEKIEAAFLHPKHQQHCTLQVHIFEETVMVFLV